jgi:DNA processing protein
MGNVERSEQVALIALLQSRPDGLSWSDITSEIVASGSAVETWHLHSPATLFEAPAVPDPLQAAAQQLDEWTAAGLTLLTVLDEGYPQRLRGIHQAPPLLFTRGRLLDDDPAVSIVGSRSASEQGLRTAGDISRALVTEGITALAGLAAGIDTATHRAALDSGGRTVAVIGTGINRYYPAANRGLQDEIAERGLLISQFLPDAPPQKHTFLMRNATMSGYGLATVVVEAGEHSGTRTQARMAVEHGRTVILMAPVIEQNLWAKKLYGRPGVHRATNVREVVDIALKVASNRLDINDNLNSVIMALK